MTERAFPAACRKQSGLAISPGEGLKFAGGDPPGDEIPFDRKASSETEFFIVGFRSHGIGRSVEKHDPIPPSFKRLSHSVEHNLVPVGQSRTVEGKIDRFLEKGRGLFERGGGLRYRCGGWFLPRVHEPSATGIALPIRKPPGNHGQWSVPGPKRSGGACWHTRPSTRVR